MIYQIFFWELQKRFVKQFFEIIFVFNWVIILRDLAQIGIDEIIADGTVKIPDPARLRKSSVK